MGMGLILISWHGWIDFGGPTIDAAGEGRAVREILAAEPVDDMEAADTVMAIDDEQCVLGEGLEMLEASRDGVHRNEFGALNAGGGELEGFADVDECGLAGVEKGAGGGGLDFVVGGQEEIVDRRGAAAPHEGSYLALLKTDFLA